MNEYPDNWKDIAAQVKANANNCCEACGHPHDPTSGHTLTVHHLDNDKANCEGWNLAALCQQCHLRYQGRLNLSQLFFKFMPEDYWLIHHLQMRDASV